MTMSNPQKTGSISIIERGFTLIELIMTIIIVGVLAVAVAPRFFDANVFKSKGFADQVQSSLRYAQKEAIARRSYVCVALAASSITLTTGATSACGSNLIPPVGQPSSCPSATYKICAPSGITLTSLPVAPPVSFSFDALGSTAVQQTITVSGAPNNIVVEAETGYVHSP
jgi:MSHA pilin protein MshC